MKLKFKGEIADMGGELVMAPMDTGEFNGVLYMNEIAADIVRLLMTDTTEDEVAKEMCRIYRASEEDIRRGVRKVVGVLDSEGLLTE